MENFLTHPFPEFHNLPWNSGDLSFLDPVLLGPVLVRKIIICNYIILILCQQVIPSKSQFNLLIFGSGRHLISKSIWTGTTTEDGQKIIEEERLTRLMNEDIFTLSDMHPGQSQSMGKDGTLVLKESSMKINFRSQRLTREGTKSSSRWRQSKDHSQIQSAPQSAESSSKEPQENDEE